MAVLRGAGFDEETAVRIYHLTAAYLVGFNFGRVLSGGMPRPDPEMLTAYPNLAALTPRLGQWPRHEFDEGLELILEQFEPSSASGAE
jgi:hypothetical protein